jgi:hypothetical protein
MVNFLKTQVAGKKNRAVTSQGNRASLATTMRRAQPFAQNATTTNLSATTANPPERPLTSILHVKQQERTAGGNIVLPVQAVRALYNPVCLFPPAFAQLFFVPCITLLDIIVSRNAATLATH